MIAMENRYLRVSILVDQGADIYELRYKPLDVDVLWRAPQELLPPGRNIAPTARAEGVFLDYLHGGWQEILPNGHLNCEYKGASLGQHGEVSVLPWSVQVREDTPEQVSVTLAVRTRRTPFYLERTMSLSRGDAVLTIDERVVNEGREPMDFMWGHHPAYGAPFIAEGCEMKLPPGTRIHIPEGNRGAHCRYPAGVSSDWPSAPSLRSEDGGFARVDRILGPAFQSDDSFYMTVPEGWYELHNPALELGLKMTWDAQVFPYVWCWQVYGGAFGYPYYGRTYNVAVEPFTSPIATLAENAARGAARRLSPGEAIDTRLTVEMFR